MSPKAMKLLAKPMLFTAALIWGTTFFITKNTINEVPVYFLLAIRFTVAAVLLALICGKRWKTFTRDYLWRAGITSTFLFVCYVSQTYGLTITTASKSAFLTAVYCVLVPFFAWGILKRRPDRYNITAAVLCIAGVGFVSLDGGAFTMNFGDVLTLVCALSYAVFFVLLEKWAEGKDIYLITTIQFVFCALYSWGMGFATETFPGQALAQPSILLPILYLCVFATALCFVLQNVALVWTDSVSASVILSLESVFGVLFSVMIYHDPITAQLILGFVLIFVAVICSETKMSFLKRKTK